jgi:FkbM family methyltransferase
MTQSVCYYRVLCWVSSLVAAVALGGCFLLGQHLNDVRQTVAAERHLSRLHEAAKHRDQNFEFVVKNYGFEYEGRTGDVIDDTILFSGVWEKHLAFFMRDYLAKLGDKGAVFIDVGCNAGHHSLFLSRFVKHVHAFDPYQPAVERFQKMIERNGFANITVHPVGLGAQEEELPFSEPPKDNFGIGSFRGAQPPGNTAKARLRVVRGDDQLAPYKLSAVELIKIDIEGFEESALIGLRKTLESHRPVVVLEITRPPGGTIASMQQLRSLFPGEYDFLVFIEQEHTWLTGRYILADFQPTAVEFFTHGRQTNLVAYPAEKRQQVPRRPGTVPTPAGLAKESSTR